MNRGPKNHKNIMILLLGYTSPTRGILQHSILVILMFIWFWGPLVKATRVWVCWQQAPTVWVCWRQKQLVRICRQDHFGGFNTLPTRPLCRLLIGINRTVFGLLIRLPPNREVLETIRRLVVGFLSCCRAAHTKRAWNLSLKASKDLYLKDSRPK